MLRVTFTSGHGLRQRTYTFTFDVATGRTARAAEGAGVNSDVHASVLVDPQASPEDVNRRVVDWLHDRIRATAGMPSGTPSAGMRAVTVGVAGAGTVA